MKILLTILIAAIFAFVFFSANAKQKTEQNYKQGGYKDLRQDEAKKNMDADKGIILVDVRTPKEYEELHIPGSMLISLETIEKEAEKKLPDKAATIYVYCRSGNRSASACKILSNLGYTNIYNIGGITAWPYETEKGSK